MLAVATALAGIGRYDGVLGADQPDEFFAQEGAGTFRVLVLGDIADANNAFIDFRERHVLPEAMQQDIESRQFLPIEVQSDPPMTGFMEVWRYVPQAGEALVVSGHVRTDWALYDAGNQPLPSTPVLFIHPEEYHEPLVFKR